MSMLLMMSDVRRDTQPRRCHADSAAEPCYAARADGRAKMRRALRRDR